MTEFNLSEFERAVRDAKDLVSVNEGQPIELYCGLTNHGATQMARALLHAKDAALEEAAKEVLDIGTRGFSSPMTLGMLVQYAADEIRSLKSNQSKAPEGGGMR